MPGTRASKITEPPTMADNPPGLPAGDASDAAIGPDTVSTTPPEAATVTAMTAPAIDFTNNDTAMVNLFERLGTLKGAASFFVLDQGIDSLAVIHDLDDDAIVPETKTWTPCCSPG